MKQIAIFSLIITALFISCNENPLAYDSNTNSRGRVTIYIEQNIQPLFETSAYSFEGLNSSAHIDMVFDKELNVINAFIDKKTNTICISRDFTKKERADFKSNGLEFRTNKVVLGAIALIAPTNSDSTYTEKEIISLLASTNTSDPIIVFDDVQSANFNYFQDKIAPKKFGKNVRCLQSNLEVIDYMKTHTNCIGVIGFNWISDLDDPIVQRRLEGIRLLEISKGTSTDFVPPYQYYVFEDLYPFTHYWYVHNKGSRANLESGFMNYMTGEKGQLIAKKSGLVSYYRIPRELQIVVE